MSYIMDLRKVVKPNLPAIEEYISKKKKTATKL